MGCLCPRRISYMAKKELFEIPVLGPVIRALGAYAVDRQGSATAAIKRSLQVLKNGGAVGIFPEGTRNRSGGLQPQTGVALLASLAGAPVVPASIRGTAGACGWPRSKSRSGRRSSRRPAGKQPATIWRSSPLQIMSAIEALAETSGGNT